jgi:xanthine dehydrogenase YagS FAD-binding subunit
MRPFSYTRSTAPHPDAAITYLAGGTTLLDLMKLDVMRPGQLADINVLNLNHVTLDAQGLHLGALARMADVADHAGVKRRYPVVAQSLMLAASPQIRNMASLGGNVLQRTRCPYFRDTSVDACNKRNPGSGCSAIGGANRLQAVLGTSDACIAAYPGDFAQALVALDATVELRGAQGKRRMPFSELHVAPGEAPHHETTLRPGEMITGFIVPAGAWTARSLYLKVRDRESYAFALASAAVALHLEDGLVREARIALGGVATKPWRAREAEVELHGRPLDEAAAERAATAAFAQAVTHGENAFKPELGRLTLVRALLQAQQMEA